jgi:hypothetical protein
LSAFCALTFFTAAKESHLTCLEEECCRAQTGHLTRSTDFKGKYTKF